MTRLRIAGVVVAAFLQLAAGAAQACRPEIEIRFFESSDGDIFIVSNTSEEPWALISLAISLRGSLGRLIFDTALGGPGYSMSAPFAPVDNEVGFLGASPVDDGAKEVILRFSDFQPGRTFTFVVDVDDRLEISDFGRAVVSGPEIAGARARGALTMTGGETTDAKGKFGVDGRAMLRGGLCA